MNGATEGGVDVALPNTNWTKVAAFTNAGFRKTKSIETHTQPFCVARQVD